MTTTATTLAAIMDQQESALNAVTPNIMSGVKLRSARGYTNFREWADANPSACLRRFWLSDISIYEPPEVSDHETEFERATVLLEVAYPVQLGLYGNDDRKDMEDFIRSDMNQIDGKIGLVGAANYVGGQCSSIALERQIEILEPVSYLRMEFEVTFYRLLSL